MVTQLKIENPSLYNIDYHLWVLDTVKKLENRDFNSVQYLPRKAHCTSETHYR